MKHLMLVFGSTALIAGAAHAQLRLIDQDYKPPTEKAAVPAAQTRPQVVAAPVRANAAVTPQATQVVTPVLAATPPLATTVPAAPRVPTPTTTPTTTPMPAPLSFQVPASAGFAVSRRDLTVRDVLVRWASVSGWAHDAEHWSVDKDHPVEGAAGPEVFGLEFKAAVRTLLSSTENSDLPVQPCFYSNRVLRVIPRAASCDRAAN
jgi:hypothetical protein